MVDYKKVLFLKYGQRKSTREIAAILKCGKTTIAEFLSRFEACDRNVLSYPLAEDVTNERIWTLLYKTNTEDGQHSQFREPEYEKVVSSLKKKGQTLKRQWRLYNQVGVVNGKKPYSYRQFCQKVADWVDGQETVSHILRNPGENIELDYAGMKLSLKSAHLSEDDIEVTIFIASLSYSSYFYAEGMTCCDEKNWIRVCNNAIYYFGGITPLITPDNCKVAVNNNKDWIDPSMNETFQNWADYYGTAILPAAVRKPRWKPAVENAVKVVTQDILVEMADMTFFSLDELNCELWKRTDKRNRENFKDLDYSRYDKFLSDEKNTLLPLPSQRFEYIQRKEAKVAPDLSVSFDGNYYLMPKKHVGSIVEVRATAFTVSIWSKSGDRIKEYRRSYDKHRWIYDEETAPRTASDYSYWTPDYFMAKAGQIGPNTRAVIEKVLSSRKYPNQSFRACYGILNFSRKYGADVLEQCCLSALEVGRPNYTYVKNIIKAEALSGEKVADSQMRYKVPDSEYSLSDLIRKQEAER